MSTRRDWTREEIILAIELYSRTPFGKMHNRNKNIIDLAEKIGRTPSSVALKMTNFASIDPTLNRTGMRNHSKLDVKVWNEFFLDTESFIEKAVNLASRYGLPSRHDNSIEIFGEGREYQATVKGRVNQHRFRQMVLASYNFKCAITGIQIPELLVASHIVPWKSNKDCRIDPRNGICLNALHDRAFDRGLITLNDDYKVVLSRKLHPVNHDYFGSFVGKQISLPSRFFPSLDYIRFHRENIFIL